MKRILSISSLLCLLLFSCSKDNLTTSFDLTQQDNFTVPASGPLGLLSLVMPPVKTDWEGTFTSNNTRKDQLKELHSKSMTLIITSPSGQTFRFLKSIELYIKADGVKEAKMAFKNSIPDNIGFTLNLDVTGLDLSPYVKKDQFTIRVSYEQDETLTNSVDIRSDMVFRATAYLLK